MPEDRPPPRASAPTQRWTDDDALPPGSQLDSEPGTLPKGTMVDHYQVVRRLGEGGMGEVYLARDTGLGRKVALKVLRPKALGSASAVDRFLFEARATARFSHPHIVTIHAVGEVDGSPYLALEYLSGQTLRERIRQRRAGVKEAVRIALAIAEALREAHRNKLLHRDLKPENVMIPRDGRIRVLDFGLAKAVADQPVITGEGKGAPSLLSSLAESDDRGVAVEGFRTREGGVRGTPTYMAPEQWEATPITAAADVWALGLTLYEMLAGRHPFAGASSYQICTLVCASEPMPALADEFPAELRQLVARCLDKDPQGRPDIGAVVAELEEMLQHGTRRVEPRPPFRGLLPCDEQDADQFHGRDAEVAAFIERLRHESVLPVVGPSGAGKSSFVQAGVVPRLREQGRWTVLTLRPGRYPFRALAARLMYGEGSRGSVLSSRTSRVPSLLSGTQSGESLQDLERAEGELAQELLQTPTRLALQLLQMSEEAEGGARVLLFVDQLEELYTQVQEASVRRAFMEALCCAADDVRGPVRVVFTLRDDFLGRLADGEAAREALSRVTVLRSPGPQALVEILTRPVQSLGFDYDDEALPARIAAAVQGEQAALPLLQVAGQMLWERRDRKARLLHAAEYEAIGGVAGSLARHADGVLEGLSAGEEQLARELLVRLVIAGSGTSGETPTARRVVERAELLDGLDDGAEEVLDRLVQGRLVLVRKASKPARRRPRPDADEAEYELVHESLIRTWERLARWLDEGREDITFLAEVGQAATLWERRGRRPEELWSGEALQEGVRRARRISAVPGQVAQFLRAGEARAGRRARNRRMALAAAFVVITLVAGVMAGLAVDARRQRGWAQQRQAEAQRDAAYLALEREDVVAARSRLLASFETVDSPLARALWWRIQRTPYRWSSRLGDAVYGVAYCPAGGEVAAACGDRSIHLFETVTGARRILRGHSNLPWVVAYSPDGRLLASGDYSGQIRLWDLEGGTVHELTEHSMRISGLSFSPDGRRLASAATKDGIALWNVETASLERRIDPESDWVSVVRFSPDGTRLVFNGGPPISFVVVDLEGGDLRRYPMELYSSDVRFTPDGRSVISAHWQDDILRIWDLDGGTERQIPTGHDGGVWVTALHPDGRSIATGSNDHDVRLIDLESGRLLQRLRGHDHNLRGVAFSSDGTRLVTGAEDSNVRLWDVDPDAAGDEASLHDQLGDAFSARFLADGQTLATMHGGEDGNTVLLWDWATRQPSRALEMGTRIAGSMAVRPDGSLLAASGADEDGHTTIFLWDPATGEERGRLREENSKVQDLRFSRDGRLLASASHDTTLRLWEIPSGRLRHRLEGHITYVYATAFSADGRWVASASADTTIRLWDTASGEAVKLLEGHGADVHDVDFHPVEPLLASAGADRSVLLWNLDDSTARELGPFDSPARSVRFSADGRALAAAFSDGSVLLWHLASGSVKTLKGHRFPLGELDISADSSLLVTDGEDGTVRLWRIPGGEPIWNVPMAEPMPASVTERGRLADRHSPDGTLCLASSSDELEIWHSDELQQHYPAQDLTRLLALHDGCLTLSGSGEVARHLLSGETQVLHRNGRAIGNVNGELWVATGEELFRRNATGEIVSRFPVAPGVTAVSRSGERVLLGYTDGNVEAVGLDGQPIPPWTLAEETFPNAVSLMIPGPEGTVVVGYDSGTVGLWSVDNGIRHYWTELYGPVTELSLADGRLYAASEIGDSLTLDLGEFYAEYCDVMRGMWDETPSDGQAGHRCSPRSD